MDIQTEISTKTQQMLASKGITLSKEKISKFVADVSANIALIFKVNKKEPKDYDVVATHDSKSKHEIPILFTFVKKRE